MPAPGNGMVVVIRCTGTKAGPAAVTTCSPRSGPCLIGAPTVYCQLLPLTVPVAIRPSRACGPGGSTVTVYPPRPVAGAEADCEWNVSGTTTPVAATAATAVPAAHASRISRISDDISGVAAGGSDDCGHLPPESGG